MMKNSVLIIATTALLGAGLWLMHTSPTQIHPQAIDATPNRLSQANAQHEVDQLVDSSLRVEAASTPRVHDQLVLAQSLRGTEIDGALKADPDGKLILDQDVRDFFDYFLSTADEIGPENAIAEIQRYIQQYLPESAAGHAQQLLSKLLQYKQYELQVQQQPLDGSQLSDMDALLVLRNSFDGLKSKRAELFSADEQQALFGLEQAYQDYTLQTLEAFADESLTDVQRQTRLDELANALPFDLQASKTEDVVVRQQQTQYEQLAAQNTDDAQYHQALIEQGSSQQKADELVSYRQQQQQFDDRYRQYRASVSQLDTNNPGFEQNLATLRQQFFSQPEQQTKAKLRDLSEPAT